MVRAGAGRRGEHPARRRRIRPSPRTALCLTRQIAGNWDILRRPEGEGWAALSGSAPINTRLPRARCAADTDGNRLIFVRIGDPQAGLVGPVHLGALDEGWSEPELLPFNSPQIDGSLPEPDGQWLYFTSGRDPGAWMLPGSAYGACECRRGGAGDEDVLAGWNQ